MTTTALTVAAIRRILDDRPDEDYTTGAIANSSVTTVTVNDIAKWVKGQWWEFDDGDDGGAEVVLVRSVDDATSTPTFKRGHFGSTAEAHSSGVVALKEPRWRFDEVKQAIDTVIEGDLYDEGIFELQEHQVTSSATTNQYNSPAAGCEKFLDVYQKTSTMTEAQRERLWYSPTPTNVDTSLFAAGKYFTIVGNYGVAGTDIYYVTCAHKLALSTLSSRQERIVQLLSTAYLLEWSEPRRLAGPANQGDQTVRPNESLRTAAYYRAIAEELLAKERQYLTQSHPVPRRFIRNAS